MPVKAKLQLPGRLARQQAQHYYAILQLMKCFSNVHIKASFHNIFHVLYIITVWTEAVNT